MVTLLPRQLNAAGMDKSNADDEQNAYVITGSIYNMSDNVAYGGLADVRQAQCPDYFL